MNRIHSYTRWPAYSTHRKYIAELDVDYSQIMQRILDGSKRTARVSVYVDGLAQTFETACQILYQQKRAGR